MLGSRKLTRYHMSAPVVCFWDDASGSRVRAEGISRDISTVGLFVWADQHPPKGCQVDCEIFLPRLSPDSKFVCVALAGYVTRCDKHGTKHHRSGFAVVSRTPLVCIDSENNWALTESPLDVEQTH